MRRQALLAGDAGYRDATPVFVVGMPRSGSTLVEQILASHSQAFGAGAAPCRTVPCHSRVCERQHILLQKGQVLCLTRSYS